MELRIPKTNPKNSDHEGEPKNQFNDQVNSGGKDAYTIWVAYEVEVTMECLRKYICAFSTNSYLVYSLDLNT